jgi:hypothetical protein
MAGGVWRSLAARFVRDEEAAGSNPATPTSSTATCDLGRWPFSWRTAVKYSKRLRIDLLAEASERLERLRVRHLGVDVHRHIDLRMPQDSHRHPRFHVQGREQGCARVPDIMDSDLADCRFAAARLEPPVEVPRLERRSGAVVNTRPTL